MALLWTYVPLSVTQSTSLLTRGLFWLLKYEERLAVWDNSRWKDSDFLLPVPAPSRGCSQFREADPLYFRAVGGAWKGGSCRLPVVSVASLLDLRRVLPFR